MQLLPKDQEGACLSLRGAGWREVNRGTGSQVGGSWEVCPRWQESPQAQQRQTALRWKRGLCGQEMGVLGFPPTATPDAGSYAGFLPSQPSFCLQGHCVWELVMTG